MLRSIAIQPVDGRSDYDQVLVDLIGGSFGRLFLDTDTNEVVVTGLDGGIKKRLLVAEVTMALRTVRANAEIVLTVVRRV